MTTVRLLDDALDEVGDRDPEYGGGLSNHGPMAVEALVHLGRADEVPAWAAHYARRLAPFTAADDERPAVLGDPATYPAWLRRATGELAVGDWRPVLVDWSTRLLDGAIAAAGHGLLRTAHAVRALTAADTPARRRELARGLAYWAATHQRLPGTPRPSGTASAADALAALPSPPPERTAFFISDAVRGLDDVPTFPAAVDALDPAQLDLTRLVDAMAPRALAGAERAAIVYVHTLTVPAAVRVLAAELPAAARPAALAATWQAMAALAAAFPVAGVAEAAASVGRPPSVDELVAAAVVNGDEHAVKVAAAAVDEVAHGADDRLLAVALALVGRMTPAGGA